MKTTFYTLWLSIKLYMKAKIAFLPLTVATHIQGRFRITWILKILYSYLQYLRIVRIHISLWYTESLQDNLCFLFSHPVLVPPLSMELMTMFPSKVSFIFLVIFSMVLGQTLLHKREKVPGQKYLVKMGQKTEDKNFLVETEDYYSSVEDSASYKGIFLFIFSMMQIPLDIYWTASKVNI